MRLAELSDALPDGAIARLGTVRFRHGSHICAIAFAPDGRSLASGGYYPVLHIWESSSGKELLRFESDRPDPGGFESVEGLAYAPDGRTLAGARINFPACLWDAATGRELRRFEARARWVVFSPDGRTFFVNLYDPGHTLAITGPFRSRRDGAGGRMASVAPRHGHAPGVTGELAEYAAKNGRTPWEAAAFQALLS